MPGEGTTITVTVPARHRAPDPSQRAEHAFRCPMRREKEEPGGPAGVVLGARAILETIGCPLIRHRPRTPPTLGPIVCVALCALALTPAGAHAAVAGQSFGEASGVLVYAADPGEANRLTISREDSRIVFSDTGAAIRPGRGCAADTPSRVSCDRQSFIDVRLEDGDDEASSTGDVSEGGRTSIALSGDQGDDTLAGAPTSRRWTVGRAATSSPAVRAPRSSRPPTSCGSRSSTRYPRSRRRATRSAALPRIRGLCPPMWMSGPMTWCRGRAGRSRPTART